MTELDVTELSTAPAGKIAELYAVVSTRLSAIALRQQLLQDKAPYFDKAILDATQIGLDRDLINALGEAHALNAATPHERLREEWERLTEDMGALAVKESLLKAWPDTSAIAHTTTVQAPLPLLGQWQELRNIFDPDEVPKDAKSIFNTRVRKSLAHARDKKELLADQARAYETIYAPWPLFTRAAEVLARPTEKYSDVRYIDLRGFLAEQRKVPASATPVRRRGAPEVSRVKGDLSRELIHILISNPGVKFSYKDLEALLYPDEPSQAANYDARVANIFHSNLPSGKSGRPSSIIFASELGDSWILVEGKRIKLDQASGRPLQRSKPETYYTVVRRGDTEQP